MSASFSLSNSDKHSAMESRADEIVYEYPRHFKLFKDGHVDRSDTLVPAELAPTGLDPKTQVETKDVLVLSESGVKARLFLPKVDGPDHKLPLVVYYHGGAFCIGSPFFKMFHNFLSLLASETKAVVISADYRLAPEHPLPTAHEDSWAALQWIASHSTGQGPEPWLNKHADFGRVFLAGESAGANISHYLAVRAGSTQSAGPNILGVVILHPYFGGKELDEEISFMSPKSAGFSDPILFPAVDPNLSRMAGARVLVCLAEKDFLRDRGVAYYETLRKSGWGGTLSFFETEGEGHAFFLFHPESDKVGPLLKKIADFISET